MSPAPDMSDEPILLNPSSTVSILNAISSSDELDHNQFNGEQMDLGLVFFSNSIVFLT